MTSITFPRFRSPNAGLLLGAALAAMTAFALPVNAAQSTAGFDRPANYDVRDQRSSGPVGAVATLRNADTGSLAARDSRCDIRDVCSETPPIAVKAETVRADAGARNPACDVRDTCTSNGTSLAASEAFVILSRDGSASVTLTR